MYLNVCLIGNKWEFIKILLLKCFIDILVFIEMWFDEIWYDFEFIIFGYNFFCKD